ncbi:MULTISPECIES: hypothetical protein [Saccharothrix]|uniref:hypothetical protein n=1 Tax=Saccharothrix TaxID=2071 RepID=UPI00093F8000|nr:hypothetical protein [Saccharothrix sp. CB00851]OKI17321.1 hypothetical protein A6A25_41045 [Saccharothrix sp. CB00851]
MAKFEDQLFEDLMRSHGSALDTVPERPASGRRGVGRVVGIGGTALGVAGVIALTGTVLTGGGPAAYAVTKGPDGVVTVSISDITGVTGANEELRRLGVRAVAVPMRDGCVDLADLPTDTGSEGTVGSATMDSVGEGGGSMTFDADAIPGGDTLLLAATQSSTSVSLAAALIKGPAPECVSVPAPLVRDPADPRQGQEVRPAEPSAATGSTVQEGGR